jgi:F0F1-type ATP synthase assembly protein I
MVSAGPTIRRAVAGTLVMSAVIALLLEPALTTSQRPEDWYQHLWYAWHQAESIRENKVPSLFAHNLTALFDAHFAFYGGTLYATVGTLGLLLGSIQNAFDISVVLALIAAYGGWYWLARMAYLGSWTSHLPGLLFITSPYYLNIIYRSGAWAELVAVSAIPLLIASGISVLRDDRLRAGPALALATSSTFLSGSHNITLLWGSIVVSAVIAVVLVCVPDARRQVTRQGARRAALVTIPAVLVNGWFLLPDIAYQSMTYAASIPPSNALQWADAMMEPRYLFSVGRPAPPPDFYVLALPLVTVGWVIAGAIVTQRSQRSSWYRLVLVLLGAVAGLLPLMLSAGFLANLPGPLPMIQFGFRLESYILLCLSGAVIGLLRLSLSTPHDRATTLWRHIGFAVAVLVIVQAAGQTRATHSFQRAADDKEDVHAYLTYHRHPSEQDYRDTKIVPTSPASVIVGFPSAERGDRTSRTLSSTTGQQIMTNLMIMPPLVTIDGARLVGHSSDGYAVLEVTDTTTPGSSTITVTAAHPWPVTLGRVLSIVGLAGLLANAIAIAPRRRHRDSLIA